MVQVMYDGSFEGLLTAIFEVYQYRFSDVRLSAADHRSGGKVTLHYAHTDREKASRVWKKLRAVSEDTARLVHLSHLSAIPGMERSILEFIRYIFSGRKGAEKNLANTHVLRLTQTANKVEKYRLRLQESLRFQVTGEALHYAIVDPDHNVLPLLALHFRRAFPRQCWLLFDEKRRYGIYYNRETIIYVHLFFSYGNAPAKDVLHIIRGHEPAFRQFLKRSGHNDTVKDWESGGLHIRVMPKEYDRSPAKGSRH